MTALVVLLALHAPAPLPKPQPREVKAGEWAMEWAGQTENCHLGSDGRYTWGSTWKGVWRWDAKKRTLHIIEWTSNPEYAILWSIPLDYELTGSATPHIKVRLRRKQ